MLVKFGTVDSNDTLYASDPHFKREIDRLCSEYLGKILGILQELGIDGKSNKQVSIGSSRLVFACFSMKQKLISVRDYRACWRTSYSFVYCRERTYRYER